MGANELVRDAAVVYAEGVQQGLIEVVTGLHAFGNRLDWLGCPTDIRKAFVDFKAPFNERLDLWRMHVKRCRWAAMHGVTVRDPRYQDVLERYKTRRSVAAALSFIGRGS